ncbi:MAG: protein-glutamate O-methyltransferase CheR [Proteocatella sp.]
MLTIERKDFLTLVKFVQDNYGIDLSKKEQLIVGRLQFTVLEKGFKDFGEYVKHITQTQDNSDIDVMLNKLTTNYTHFLREEKHFDFMKTVILPNLEKSSKNKVLSIWSAGCSSGEEPYTMSMVLSEHFDKKANEWDTRVLATDISQNVLNKAQNAAYNVQDLENIPNEWKLKYFVKDQGASTYKISPEIKRNVIFRTFNLMDPIKFKMKFDVIFCRNVMIYFDKPTRAALIKRFYEATNPGGYLFIGHSESLNKDDAAYKQIGPSIYRKPIN